jgi:hypothetical protein
VARLKLHALAASSMEMTSRQWFSAFLDIRSAFSGTARLVPARLGLFQVGAGLRQYFGRKLAEIGGRRSLPPAPRPAVKTLSAGFERQVRDYVAAIWIKLGELEGKMYGGVSNQSGHFSTSGS